MHFLVICMLQIAVCNAAGPPRSWTDIDNFQQEDKPTVLPPTNATGDVFPPVTMKVPLYMEIIATAATISNLLLFLSPIATMKEMIYHKSVGNYSPLPYIFTLLSCGVWTVYCFDLGGRRAPGTVNAIGCGLSAIYIIIFLCCMSRSPEKNALLQQMTIQFSVVGGIVGGSFFFRAQWRSALLGTLADCFCLMAYASPLVVIRIVLETGSVRYMPLPLSTAVFGASSCWALYAHLKHDRFIFLPNAVGSILGAVQLFVYAIVSVRSRQDEALLAAIENGESLDTSSKAKRYRSQDYGALSNESRQPHSHALSAIESRKSNGLLRRPSRSLVCVASLADLTQELSYWQTSSSVEIPAFENDVNFVRRVSTESSFDSYSSKDDNHPFMF